MKGLVIGIVFGAILVFILLLAIGILMNDQRLVGSAVNTYTTQQSNQLTGQAIIDNEQQLNENMYYSQTFEVYETEEIYVNITSNGFVNYVLLPDYEVDHYAKGESFKSYANSERILFVQDTYSLDVGKYSVVITSIDEPVNVHLIVEAV
jgi:hypothetical protein